MSTFRTPVGPQPSRVYWRRRLVVLLGVVAVIVIIILIVNRPAGTPTPAGANSNSPSAPVNSPAASPNPSDSAVPSEPVDPSTVDACDPDKVKVTALTDYTEYQDGENPKLSFSIKSSMTSNCSISAGSDVQEYRITSGDELIWTSKDCQTDEVAAEVVLEPGKPIDGASLTWDRTRSDKDTCDEERDTVTADGASYHFEVRLGKSIVSTDKQFLLY